MRRIVALVLVIIATFAFTACKKEKSEPSTVAPSSSISVPAIEEINLTPDNIEDYLHIESYGNGSSKSAYSVKVFPIKAGKFENVEITYKVYLGKYWQLLNSDSAYKNFKTSDTGYNYFTHTIMLPVSGETEIVHKVSPDFFTPILAEFDDVVFDIRIVKGSFKPD